MVVGKRARPMDPEYDEERLGFLHDVRTRFLDAADAGDETAARIVQAIESMIAEVEEWLRLPGQNS
jgi:hypothetical protein